nr:NDR1/HIN1-like protein 13 [Lolium perenne]
MMNDGRVHPTSATSSDFSAAQATPARAACAAAQDNTAAAEAAQPGTYVVEVPKDKVFRMPPPKNEHLFQQYTRLAKRRSSCSSLRACLYLLLAILCLNVFLVGRPSPSPRTPSRCRAPG